MGTHLTPRNIPTDNKFIILFFFLDCLLQFIFRIKKSLVPTRHKKNPFVFSGGDTNLTKSMADSSEGVTIREFAPCNSGRRAFYCCDQDFYDDLYYKLIWVAGRKVFYSCASGQEFDRHRIPQTVIHDIRSEENFFADRAKGIYRDFPTLRRLQQQEDIPTFTSSYSSSDNNHNSKLDST